MLDVISASTVSPHLLTLSSQSFMCTGQDRMGCSTSTQTSAVDTTRPSAKPEESNGASTTGAANENGNVAEDSETIPDQTPAEGSEVKPADEPALEATSADSTAASPPAGEESQDAADSPPEETAPPGEAAAGDSAPETAASSSEAEAAAPEPEPEKETAAVTDSEPNTDNPPAPSE